MQTGERVLSLLSKEAGWIIQCKKWLGCQAFGALTMIKREGWRGRILVIRGKQVVGCNRWL
jgi:hypothetical protein